LARTLQGEYTASVETFYETTSLLIERKLQQELLDVTDDLNQVRMSLIDDCTTVITKLYDTTRGPLGWVRVLPDYVEQLKSTNNLPTKIEMISQQGTQHVLELVYDATVAFDLEIKRLKNQQELEMGFRDLESSKRAKQAASRAVTLLASLPETETLHASIARLVRQEKLAKNGRGKKDDLYQVHQEG
jgi:hypothetical protein